MIAAGRIIRNHALSAATAARCLFEERRGAGAGNNRFSDTRVGSNMSRFCANLAFMFNEGAFLERYQLARDAGFKAVETGFPFGFGVDEVRAAKEKAGVHQVLLNIFTGDVTKGELGFAAVPGKEADFKDSISKTIIYAKALGAEKIHIMSGKVAEPTSENDACYEANLRYAVRLLEKENILGVIEPINKYSVPGYYMNSYDKALSIVKSINSPNLRIMLDVFHAQHIRGNLTNCIKDLKDYIGHVQIAQVPNRNEPDTVGEISYTYILSLLQEVGYSDWIGLEYKPLDGSTKGLKWIESYGYAL